MSPKQRVALPLASKAADGVYRSLKARIVSMEFKPGELLAEKDLAGEYQTSKTPVREALIKLRADGLVAVLTRKGWMVTEPSLQDVQEMFQIREGLEGMAARVACRRAAEDEISHLASITEEMASQLNTGDIAGFLETDGRFHSALLQASGNRQLSEILERFEHHVRRVRNLLVLQPHRLTEALAEHRSLVAAIQARDEDSSERYARSHADLTRKCLESLLGSLKGQQLQALDWLAREAGTANPA